MAVLGLRFSVRGLSLVAASGGHSSSRCAGLSLLRPLLLQSTSSRCAGSVVVARGPSCSAARGIFPDQGSNPCPLHWQADSQPLFHQGSLLNFGFISIFILSMGVRKEFISDKKTKRYVFLHNYLKLFLHVENSLCDKEYIQAMNKTICALKKHP